jgi:thioredoxin 1
MANTYEEPGPTRDEVESWPGATVLEFGAEGCGYCQAAQPAIAESLRDFPNTRHVKVADGKGKPLGRSYGVKLWPTLIFLRDGQETGRVVRPTTAEEVLQGFETMLPPG